MQLNTNRLFVYVFVGACCLPLLFFAPRLIWPVINDVRTGGTPEYPDIQPQTFAQPFDKVFDAALAVVQSQQWELRMQERGEGLIECVATTKLLKFKDDVTITLTRTGEATTVNVRSHSRVGKSDLGANAKRIRMFQAELAKQL